MKSTTTTTSSSSTRLAIYLSILLLAVIILVYIVPFNETAMNALNASDTTSKHNNNNNKEEEENSKSKNNNNNPVKKTSNEEKLSVSLKKSTNNNNNDGVEKEKKEEKQQQIPASPPPDNSAAHNLILSDFEENDELPLYKNIWKDIPISVATESSSIFQNVLKRWQDSFDEKYLQQEGSVVPALIIPTFHDSEHLQHLLLNFDTPVRSITFICNADDSGVLKILKTLKLLVTAGAVSIYRRPQNAGFSAAVNLGLRRNRRVLTKSGNWDFKKNPLWYFVVNCDSIFQPGSAAHFSKAVQQQLLKNNNNDNNNNLESLSDQKKSNDAGFLIPNNINKNQPAGLFYTTKIDHFCFGISEAAISLAGEMDESFYPAYMEDVDWRWRVHLAGFDDFITGANVGHHRSVNLKKASPNSPFMQMLHRTARGWEYGRMKWGNIGAGRLRNPVPPTGRRTPFGIKNAPLSLWKIDPVHRECVISGRAGTPRFKNSGSCWYNGTVLLEILGPKVGTTIEQLPEFLVHPVESMDKYYARKDREDMIMSLSKGKKLPKREAIIFQN